MSGSHRRCVPQLSPRNRAVFHRRRELILREGLSPRETLQLPRPWRARHANEFSGVASPEARRRLGGATIRL